MSAKRTADRFIQLLEARFNIEISGTENAEILQDLYQSMIDEIKLHMEAKSVESPSIGYFVQDGVTNTPVQGTNVTGKIDQGNFR